MQIDSSTPRRSYAMWDRARPSKNRLLGSHSLSASLERQSESEVREPFRHHAWVLRVDVLVAKVLVEHVVDVERQQASTLWKPIAEHRVGRPERVLTWLRGSAERRHEQAFLMVVGDTQARAKPGAAEVVRLER